MKLRNLGIAGATGALIAAAGLISAQEQQPKATAADDFLSEIKNQVKGAENTTDAAPSRNPHIVPYAAVILASKWDSPNVYVCWENGSESNENGMKWTREAVEATWQKASSLRFIGWNNCARKNAGIRIRIEDTGPHVTTIGKYLNNEPNRMVLNFTFKNWSTDCQKELEHCIKVIAVHEFGHAIGLVHEQNRPDAPGECKTLAQGSSPDVMLTPYDADSVMNYCNKKWNNDGVLSKDDIAAVRELYPPPQT